MQNLLSRFLSLFRVDMSNNQLRSRLQKALREIEKEFIYVEDEDIEKGIVVYATWDYDYTDKWWQRTFTLDANGSPTLNDDKQAVEPVRRYEVIPSETDESSITAAQSNHDHNSTCSCHAKGDHMAFNRKEAIPRIAQRLKLDIKVLEAADDTVLEKLDDPDTSGASATEKVKQDKTVPPNTGPEPREDPRPSSDLIEVPVEETEDKEQIKNAQGQSSVTLADIQKLLSPITAQLSAIAPIVAQAQAKENEHRASLISSLKTASKFSEDQLKAMSTDHLVTLADSLQVLTPAPIQLDYTGSRVLSSPSGSEDAPPPAPKISVQLREKSRAAN